MKICELSRKKSPKVYEAQGYPYIEGKVLKGKELKDKSCSLFLTRYKQTLAEENVQKLQVYYADMMEVITGLMAKTKMV